jgi:hypothetical protein
MELASPGVHLNKRRLVIESKQSMTGRGVASPERADALCLTFALPVSPKPRLHLVHAREPMPRTGTSWMGRDPRQPDPPISGVIHRRS